METIWWVLIALIFLAAVLALLEWFQHKEIRIQISSWGDLQENQILIDIINDFRKNHPYIQVTLERSPYFKYTDHVLERTGLGRGPDVIFVEVNNFADFYLQGLLEPLDSYVEKARLDLKEFYPAILDRFTAQGQTFAIPRDTAPWCLVYYNQDAFQEAGIDFPDEDWDWNRFMDTARKLVKTDEAGQVLRWGVIDDKIMPNAWVLGAGGTYANDVRHPTRWTFATDPNSLQGVRFRYDLIHKHKVTLAPSQVLRMEESEGSDMFFNGETAMYISGLKWTPFFRGIRQFKWDVAILPRGPQGIRAFPTGGSGYGISKYSKNKKAAWKLVEFITSLEGMRKRASNGLAQPALVKIANSPLFLDQQPPLSKKILLEAVQHVKYFPLCRNWREIEALIVQALDPVWKGTRTPEEAMERLKPLLEKNPPITD